MGIFYGPRVIGTDMRSELLVSFLTELRLHLFNGMANQRP
jgi:hypothetical protein